MNNIIYKECSVIGCGISGIAVARWLKQYNIDFVVFEKSNDIGGLWRYSEKDYGVMSFTHINVSKYNYCFSDFPYPENTIEFMHNKQIYEYAKSYMIHHDLYTNVKFNHQLVLIEELNQGDELYDSNINFPNIKTYNKLWKLEIKNLNDNSIKIYISPYVSIATGHHGTPKYVKFPGQETFPGEIIHSVKYKNAKFNKMEGKKVLLVGIGNSSVDVADNLVTEGGCTEVSISTRSGSWIYPNYLTGYPMDLYVNRFILYQPWQIANIFMETLIKFANGNPKKYNLNPKSKILQYHPTVSPTLCHYIQRGRVTIKSNIKKISGNRITFENEENSDYDSIILCTGYKIDLNFLSNNLKKMVFSDENELYLDLYKLVFHPKIGSSLSFIGFVQPHSGGILPVSEIQARWFVYLMTNKTKLPSENEMFKQIEIYKEKTKQRFYESSRHTIQEDPILYNDEISSFFGAKPRFSSLQNLSLLWRFIFSACGPAQWRLNGPDKLDEAAMIIKKVPVPTMTKCIAIIQFFVILFAFFYFFHNPYLLPILALPFLFYLKIK